MVLSPGRHGQWDDDYGRSPGIHPAGFDVHQEYHAFGGALIWRPSQGQVGPRLGWGMQDDADAFLYYSLLGLNPVSMVQNLTIDARFVMLMTGFSFGPSAAVAIGGGMVVAGAVGWAVDPMHKREGGMDDWDWDPILDVVYYEWR